MYIMNSSLAHSLFLYYSTTKVYEIYKCPFNQVVIEILLLHSYMFPYQHKSITGDRSITCVITEIIDGHSAHTLYLW